ncbi:Snf7-domain-containing protein [Polychytrium aggregatum]|uniref:Snf7-domain-containing protein n=1 Tax=Polychytrium aggregatum TaxID=110093 RepID=UPI0022FDB14E|nr:Snf7-domain-containing protein [Polychytrium aggregatum]KAI9209380.1 Snf7-domain-containing protein [Polychytrium aggregatum]
MGNAAAKPSKITSKDKAILDLKVQRDKLKQYQKKIELVLNKEVEVAKFHLARGDRGRALLALKKKKYQEQLLEKTDEQLLNLEQLVGTIEYALVEQDILKGLQQGNDVLKEIHKEMSVDAVQKLMDDTADAIEYQREIDDILSGQITQEDEEEIMAELDQMLEEEAAAQVGKLPDVPIDLNARIPDAQTTKLPADPISQLANLPSPPSELPEPSQEQRVQAKAKIRKSAEEEDEGQLVAA